MLVYRSEEKEVKMWSILASVGVHVLLLLLLLLFVFFRSKSGELVYFFVL